MVHYFTREEAEALLPALTIVLQTIQECREKIRTLEGKLVVLRKQAMGNGHHLPDHLSTIQQDLLSETLVLRNALHECQAFGCEIKDLDTGLIDFLSLRNGKEIYLCWRLGEQHVLYWHPLDTGIAGRQPL